MQIAGQMWLIDHDSFLRSAIVALESLTQCAKQHPPLSEVALRIKFSCYHSQKLGSQPPQSGDPLLNQFLIIFNVNSLFPLGLNIVTVILHFGFIMFSLSYPASSPSLVPVQVSLQIGEFLFKP